MQPTDATDLNLLLAYADDHGAVLPEGLPHDAAGDERVERGGLDVDNFYDAGAAGNDIGAQGWGVVAPEGKRGDEMLARIRPLIDARDAQQPEPTRVYRVPARMTTDQALRWRQDVYNNDEPDRIPRYQLFLGDLHEVPLELQQVQAPEGFVGRLAFNDLEGYDAYVEKILQWERDPSPVSDGNATFFSVRDGTSATQIGYRGLIEPVVARARAMKQEGRFHAGEISDIGDPDQPSQDELLDAAAGLEAGVLFTMSHGEGAPRQGWTSARAQLNGQGAMSFGASGNLPGRELANRAFVPGGVWFMFACFGAGTPQRSKFHHWLSQLASAGQFRGRPDSVLASLPKGEQRPFIAALPQAALASPDGPIAFIGHLDLAWTYSFMEIGQGKQKGRPEKYYNILKSLFRGDRVGVALQEIERFYNDKNQELTDLYDLAEEAAMNGGPAPADRSRISHLWMVRQDLSGYILLGDPAVQLPLSRTERPKRPRGQRPVEVHSEAPAATPPAATPPAATPPAAPSSFAAEPHDEAPAPTTPERAGPTRSASLPSPVDAAPESAVKSTPPASISSPAAPDSDSPPLAVQPPAVFVEPPAASAQPTPEPAGPSIAVQSPAAPSEPPAALPPGSSAPPIAADPPLVAQPPVAAGSADDRSSAGHPPAGRDGEVAGEIEIDGRDGVKVRWRVRWRLG